MSASSQKSPALSDDTSPYDDLRRAVRRRFGARAQIDNIVAPTLGGSNRTIVFDLVEGAATRRLVSRQETYSGEGSPFLPPAKQFRIMRIVHRHGLPVPEPVFEYDDEDAMGSGFVTAFVAGETMPKRIIGDPGLARARSRLPAQLAEFLAGLNRIPLADIAFLDEVTDSIDPVAAQRRRYEAYGEVHPAIELGFRWLELHRPEADRRVLAHGDFRNGNFMVGPDGLVAVLDWECSHIGSRAEDFGWLSTRSWRFGHTDLPVGGFSARLPLHAAYEAAGGDAIDLDRVRYWEVFGLLRWAVINLMQAHGHVFGGRRSVVFAACGRNASLIEYELLMTIAVHYR